MSKESKPANHQLSQKQWAAIATAGVAGTVAAGPIGAAGANFFGWEEGSQSSSSGS